MADYSDTASGSIRIFVRDVDEGLEHLFHRDVETRILLTVLTEPEKPGPGRNQDTPYKAFELTEAIYELLPEFRMEDQESTTRKHRQKARERAVRYVERIIRFECDLEMKVIVLGSLLEGFKGRSVRVGLKIPTLQSLLCAAQVAVDFLSSLPGLNARQARLEWDEFREHLEKLRAERGDHELQK